VSNYTYDITRVSITRYEFYSVGPKGSFLKAVEIQALNRTNTFNVCFGDVYPDGCIDDRTETNNSDLRRVLGSVVHIIKEYLRNKPEAILYFQGSTPQRTTIYQYILRRYYEQFSLDYSITAILEEAGVYQQVIYEPDSGKRYFAFFIQKNSKFEYANDKKTQRRKKNRTVSFY
jgi:hypothetical protein